MSTIYLVRHGETVWNTQTRLQGQGNSPLTERGLGQARALGRLLAGLLNGTADYTIACSPLGRARQTAEIITGELGVSENTIQTELRLAELGFGRWEGLTIDEVRQRHPDDWARRECDRWAIPAPDGETYAELSTRVGDWMADIPDGHTVVAVCHGGTARVMRGLYAGLPNDVTMNLEQPQDRLFRLSGGTIEEILA